MTSVEKRERLLDVYANGSRCAMPGADRSPECHEDLHPNGGGFDLDHINGRKRVVTEYGVGVLVVHPTQELVRAMKRFGHEPAEYLGGTGLHRYLLDELDEGRTHRDKIRAVCRACNIARNGRDE